MTDLERATQLLGQGNYTCVFCRDAQLHTAKDRGIRPVLACLDSGSSFAGFSAADKVVGKATAFLYVLLGIRALYAPVMSRAAVQVLEAYGISHQYGILTDGVLNHRQNGPCPMEDATKDCRTPEEALIAIRQRLKQLNF